MSRVTAPLGALARIFANRDLGRLELAWGGMSFATWTFAIALGVYAFNAAGPGAVGVAALIRLLPGALTAPFGGLLGDRHSRRSVLLWSACAAACALAASAAAVAAGAPVWSVFALAGLFTVTCSPYVPAEGALLPQLARTPQELSAANVAHSVMDNLGFLAGALLTGGLLAVTSIEAIFALAAVAAALTAVTVALIAPDARPDYALDVDAGGLVRETAIGFRVLVFDPQLRVLGAALTLIVFVEGAVDVLAVVVALDLLGLAESSVGFLNAAWGAGALAAAGGLAILVHRRQLVGALVSGSLLIGAAIALPALWPTALVAFVAWPLIGGGYTLVEVVVHTLLQRLGDDEVLARVRGSLETARLAAMALGSLAVTVMVEAFGVREALLAVALVLPLFALLRWGRLRSYEIGAPVAERHFALLRVDPIFAPLPLATLERLAQDLAVIEVGPGRELIVQGEAGDRFYLIDSGRVEVIRDGVRLCDQGPGESFGEIALIRDEPRSATVRALEPTCLLALEREQFIAAVTGHRRSSQAADGVIVGRSNSAPPRSPG